MATLLRIDSSPRVEGSFSRSVTDSYEQAWLAAHPGDRVIHRDLAAHPLPHLDADSAAQRANGYPLSRELTAELLEADTVVIGAPMHNWSITSSLKAWIDHVFSPSLAVGADGQGPLVGTRVVIVTARGGGYTAGSPKAHMDHQTPYLDMLFGVVGIVPEWIHTELTLAPVVPAMAELVGLHESGLATAHARATEVAAAA